MRTLFLTVVLSVFPGLFAFGLTPHIKVPEWNRLHVSISSWDPVTGELKLAVSVTALGTAIRDITLLPRWPKPVISDCETLKCGYLQAGRTWKNWLRAKVPTGFSGWIDFDVSAIPDEDGMQRLIAASEELSEGAKKILAADFQGINEAIRFGESFPLFTNSDMAILSMPQLVFSEYWLLETGRALIFWAPDGELGSARLRDSYSRFRNALLSKDSKAALAALANLVPLVDYTGETVDLKSPGSADPVQISSKALKQALEADRLVLEILAEIRKPQEIEEQFKENRPTFCDGFLWANLGTISDARQDLKTANKAYLMALEHYPAWPLIYKWRNEIRRKQR